MKGYLLFFENFDRDFGTIGIKIAKIGLQIRTCHPRIRLYSNFGKFSFVTSLKNYQSACFFFRSPCTSSLDSKNLIINACDLLKHHFSKITQIGPKVLAIFSGNFNLIWLIWYALHDHNFSPAFRNLFWKFLFLKFHIKTMFWRTTA